MKWLRSIRWWVYDVARKRRIEREMEEEIRAHILMRTRDNLSEGMAPEEGSLAARKRFGNIPQIKELCRDATRGHLLEAVSRDARHALRALANSPGFSVVAILTLGLGIGAVTAIFALVNAILLQPLPYSEPQQLVAIKHAAPGLGLEEAGLSSGTYFHYRTHATSFEKIGLYREQVLNLSGPEAITERVEVTSADPEFFRILGVRPELGRLFTEEDGSPGFMNNTWPVPVLLSHELWQGRYGGDPTIIEQMITLNERARKVVGILPPNFAFPRPDTQIWILSMPPEVTANFAQALDWQSIARLRPGIIASTAVLELERILPAIKGIYRDATAERLAEVQLTPIVVPLKEEVVGNVGTVLWILFGGMAFLLAVGCANVANLFLLRTEHRAREIAVRTAVGARTLDLLRLFLSEAIVLCGVGAAFAVLLAAGSVKVLVAFTPLDLPRLNEVRLDGWGLVFAAGLALLAALLAGGLSFLRHSWSVTAIAKALKSGGWGTTGNRERCRTRDVLIVVQVALALNLVVGSGLMLQSFWRLTRVDPGFDAADVLTVEIALPGRRAGDHQRIYEGVVEQVRALPGVRSAAAISSVPLVAGEYAYPLRIVNPAMQSMETDSPVTMKFVTPGYFQTMKIAVVRGTGLEPGQRTEFARPVIVSAALARRLFRLENPIGEKVLRLEVNGNEVEMSGRPIDAWTIAGVVADVHDGSLREDPAEILYIPVIEPRVEPSITPTNMTLAIRTDVPPLSLAAAARQTIRESEPALSVARIRTMDAIVSRSTAKERFLAVLLVIAATASLFLGTVGIYGVIVESARRRRPEVGIRMAMGARPLQIAELVLRESSLIVLIGVGVGITTALAMTRFLRSLLFGISATDPLTLAAASLLLVVVAGLAGLMPARRAARTEPMAALRAE